jgi:serine/threonine protein kinase
MATEIKALRLLRDKGSKHSPQFVAEFHTIQGDDGLVPSGFISYIVMTWCPGITLRDSDYQVKYKDQQARIFRAFKEALE